MLLKEKFFIVSVLAAVVASLLAHHAAHCVMEMFDGNCGFGLATLVTTAARFSGMLCHLWHS
jgi:hypothetical protein